jgi:hypothetical protein
MISPDPQLARAEIILAANRPAPEPTEHELREILEHLGAREAQTETVEAAR